MEETRAVNKKQLRIPVRGTNRKYYLVAPAPAANRPDYYVRFDVPRDIRATDPKLPKTVYRSTGTNILRAARERGRAIIEAVLERRWSEAERTKLRGGCSTVGELVDAYQPDPRVVSAAAARNNRSALLLIVREALGREDARDVRLDDALNGQTLRKWIALRQARVAKADYVVQGSAANTINATIRQARSVISPKVMDLYGQLRLPDLTEFRKVRKVHTDKDVSYKPLSQAVVDAIEEDARRLKRGESEVASAAGVAPGEQVQVYRAYLLMKWLALRNSEAEHAKEEWIVRHEHGGGAELEIKRRPYFVTKNKRYRTLEIPPAVLAELDEQRGLPDAWIVNAPSATERYELPHTKLNAWLRHFIPDRGKCAYELRKHAISIIVTRPESEGGGLVAAAEFAGDSIVTTEKHYASNLRKVRSISPDEMAQRRAGVVA